MIYDPGLDHGFRCKVIRLLDLGYSLRLRLPLFVSAAFVLCHFVRYFGQSTSNLNLNSKFDGYFSNYIPRVEINVQVIEEEPAEDQDTEGED